MSNKITYDARGPQHNIARQIKFNLPAFFHMLFYRILIIFSLVTFAIFVLNFYFNALYPYIAYLIVVIWILFIPQLFSLLEGLAMVGSGGLVFGHLNPSYLDIIDVNKKGLIIYRLLPYAGIAAWLIALGVFIVTEIL